MNPSDFHKFPYDSILQNTEHEIVARNIMVILARTGNTFRSLSWEEYELERMKDGGFSGVEFSFFEKVVGYCSSEFEARGFCSNWY